MRSAKRASGEAPPLSSSTKCIASTKRSRMPSFRTSKPATSLSSARPRKILPSRSSRPLLSPHQGLHSRSAYHAANRWTFLRRALADKERGLGNENVQVSDEILFPHCVLREWRRRASAYNTLEPRRTQRHPAIRRRASSITSGIAARRPATQACCATTRAGEEPLQSDLRAAQICA